MTSPTASFQSDFPSDAPTSIHPLDNVIWNALATTQAHCSSGGHLARRYRREFSRFGGMRSTSPDGFQALAADMLPEDTVALLLTQDVDPGRMFEVIDRKRLVQMVGAISGKVDEPQRFRSLGLSDVPQMTKLAQLTAPGPWFERTAELGRFVGLEVDGKLVAMAGERMRLPGYTEISAVCCHPDYRGGGFPTNLMRLISEAIVARNETPFLHVFAENTPAVTLYEKLGMRARAQFRLLILRRCAP